MQPPSTYKPTAYTSNHMKSQHISSAAYPGHSTSCHLNHVNFQGSDLSATYIYQKDERALFGNLPLRYVFFPCNECSVSTRTLLFFKTLIFHVMWCPVAMWNFSTDRLLRGKFVSDEEEERINCVVKSLITFEIHEGLWNAGRWNGGVMQHARGNEKWLQTFRHKLNVVEQIGNLGIDWWRVLRRKWDMDQIQLV